MLSYFPHIQIPNFSGDIKADIKALLELNKHSTDYESKTFVHVKAVADKNMEIAKQYGLDAEICGLCGYLHDISGIMSYSDMTAYAVGNGWHIYEAEKKAPILLHPRISKAIAKEDFGITDERILSAVECHATLKANPSAYDMALFVADKLAWDQDGVQAVPPFYDILTNALKQSLEAASLAYMDYIVEHKMILYPHQWFDEGMRFLHRK